MPVKRSKIVRRLLLCGLLPAFNASAGELPSMAFLEYLGGVENEIDGQLSSPVELDLEAALVASNAEQKKSDEVKAAKQAANEDSTNE